MRQWYGKTASKVVQNLDSDISLGLNENKIKYMRETHGVNTILKPKIESLLTLLIEEMKQLWILESMLFISMLIYNGLHIIALIISFLIIISVILLISGDYKEEKKLMAINNLNTAFSEVIRNGKTCRINCEEMVVGDIVFLESGSPILADMRILECEGLKVKQPAVTGEKYEVEKYSMKIEGEVINLSGIKNIVFKSSIITEGSALGIVIATGMNTQIGKIVEVLLNYKNNNRLFSKKVNKIANSAGIIALIASVIALVFIYTLHKNFGVHEIINVLIYISMTFNSSIFIIILFLFFNFIFMGFKKKNIIIKNISAIYSLGNISTIFTKKIGAISENKLIFKEVYCDNIIIHLENQCLIIEDTIERIMSIALLCNDSKIYEDNKPNIEISNSIESLSEYALLEFCNETIVKLSEAESKQLRTFTIPYDSEKRIKTVVNKIEDRYRANVSGILDSLLNKCTHILINGVEKEIKETDIQSIIKTHIDMSNRAYSVIAYGYRNFNYEPSIHENIESNLVFVGLMGFENPIKESSYGAMKTCKEINIRVIIDEEDNKLASLAFGKLIGLAHNKEEILSGIEIDYMSTEEFESNIENISIFSKISSENKSDIVNCLENKGYSVASVGDRLTDLEYLNNSHIAISSGNECSKVVRKLSSIFLQENDFSEIINLAKHSKKIIKCINKLGLFLSVVGLSEILIILLCLVIMGIMPLSLIEAIYLNYIIVPSCGLVILLKNYAKIY